MILPTLVGKLSGFPDRFELFTSQAGSILHFLWSKAGVIHVSSALHAALLFLHRQITAKSDVQPLSSVQGSPRKYLRRSIWPDYLL